MRTLTSDDDHLLTLSQLAGRAGLALAEIRELTQLPGLVPDGPGRGGA